MTYEIKYRREDEMKDSGIQWLGKVPKEWISNKVKYNIHYIQTGSTPTTKRLDYYEGNVNWFNPVDLNQEILEESKKKISKQAIIDNEAKLFSGDSVLIVGIGATAGKTSYLINRSSFNQQITGIHSKENNNKYIFYQFKSISKELLKLANFTTLPILNNEFLKNIVLGFPELIEQQKIVNFLNLKTAEFDSLISKKELLIEKLEEAMKSLISEVVTGKVKIVNGELVERDSYEMKDSGVQWLGMIPKDWGFKKLKYLIKSNGIVRGPFGSALKVDSFVESGYKVYEQKNAIYDSMEIGDSFISSSKFNNLKRFELKEGDFIVSCSGTIGKIAYVEKLEQPGIINQALMIIRINNKYNEQFFEIVFSSKIFQREIVDSSHGSAMKNLVSTNVFKNNKFPKPTYPEQIIIVNFIDEWNRSYLLLAKKYKRQIQKLKQAKQSLISEAVTGKIDLRDWEIQEI